MIYLAYGVGIVAIVAVAVIFIKIIYSFGEEFQFPNSKPHSQN